MSNPADPRAVPDEMVFPRPDSGGSVHVGTVKCPLCHRDLTIAIREKTSVRLSKPPRRKKVRLEP